MQKARVRAIFIEGSFSVTPAAPIRDTKLQISEVKKSVVSGTVRNAAMVKVNIGAKENKEKPYWNKKQKWGLTKGSQTTSILLGVITLQWKKVRRSATKYPQQQPLINCENPEEWSYIEGHSSKNSGRKLYKYLI